MKRKKPSLLDMENFANSRVKKKQDEIVQILHDVVDSENGDRVEGKMRDATPEIPAVNVKSPEQFEIQSDVVQTLRSVLSEFTPYPKDQVNDLLKQINEQKSEIRTLKDAITQHKEAYKATVQLIVEQKIEIKDLQNELMEKKGFHMEALKLIAEREAEIETLKNQISISESDTANSEERGTDASNGWVINENYKELI